MLESQVDLRGFSVFQANIAKEDGYRMLIKEMTNHFLNTPALDGSKCHRCKLPTNGRASRIDCESPRGKLMTFHKECWLKEINSKT